MFFHIPQVLTPEEIETLKTLLLKAEFIDGKSSAGAEARQVKNNLQIIPNTANCKMIEKIILKALYQHDLIQNFAFPKRIFSLLISKYELGMYYGNHVDNPIMIAGQPQRTDLSMTLFLNQPNDYGGGELVIETLAGAVRLKMPCGDAIIYPSSSLHRVEPVTSGYRLAAVAWIQSFVRDPSQRELLFELGKVRSRAASLGTDTEESATLSKIYGNLLRMWAEI